MKNINDYVVSIQENMEKKIKIIFADWGEDEEDDYIVSEGDMVADDLICKVISDNDGNIQLPVELKYLKDYCITSLISPKLMDRVITWIILRYATTYYCLTNPKKISSIK